MLFVYREQVLFCENEKLNLWPLQNTELTPFFSSNTVNKERETLTFPTNINTNNAQFSEYLF